MFQAEHTSIGMRTEAEGSSHSALGRTALLVSLAAALAAGCSSGDRQVAGPPDDGGASPTTDLTVRVMVAQEDAALAASLGWQGGVPGAEVHVLRNGEATWDTLTTGSDGEVMLPNIVNGLFRVYAMRRLTTAESQQVGGTIRAFGDGGTFKVGIGTTLELRLLADRAGGLVISEYNQVSPPPQETGGAGYNGDHYIEVYNNSAQTIMLDGKLFGRAYFFGQEDFSFNPCMASQATREDPGGIFTREALAFPGSGSEHPIGPGETRLVAFVAIDHTPVHPWLFDLSGADFEIHPVGAADNPAVPNMINVGEEPWRLIFSPLITGPTYYLSDPVDVQSLPIAFRDHTGRGYVQLPADKILDAVSFSPIFVESNREFPPCAPLINKQFDRYENAEEEFGDGIGVFNLSAQRIVLRDAGGRAILQNTNTTAADFVYAAHTPGTILP